MNRDLSRSRKSEGVRLCSWVVVCLFTVTSVLGEVPLYAQTIYTSFVPEVQGFEGDAHRLTIPAELGKINDYYIPTVSHPNPFVIHIQDAHANPEAQRNIRDILKYLDQHRKEMSPLAIGVEGAQGQINPQYLNLFPDYPEMNDIIIDELSNKGELTGAELFAWEVYRESVATGSRFEPRVFGVEAPELYKQNLENYMSLLNSQLEIKKSLNGWRKHFERLKSRLLSPEIRKFIKERDRRRHGNYGDSSWSLRSPNSPQTLVYLKYLSQQSKEILGIDLSHPFEQVRFPNLVRAVQLSRLEPLVDQEKSAAEQGEVMKRIQAKARPQEASEVLTAFKKFESEADPRGKIELIWKLAKKLNVDLKGYKHLWIHAARVIFESEIDPSNLFFEVDQLESWLFEKMVKTEQEKQLLSLIENFQLFEKLVTLSLTREEYLSFLSKKDLVFEAVDAERVLTIVSESETERKRIGELELRKSDLKEYGERAIGFYKGAEKRDEALLVNTLALTEEDAPSVLISGGFHTFGVTQLMKEQEIAYTVIQPKIKFHDDGDLYHKVLKNENADLSAYFDKPYLTKQESIYLKSILEIAVPAFWEKFQISHTEIGFLVAEAINKHPVLSQRIKASSDSLKGKSKVRLQIYDRKEWLARPKNNQNVEANALSAPLVTDADDKYLYPDLPKDAVIIDLEIGPVGTRISVNQHRVGETGSTVKRSEIRSKRDLNLGDGEPGEVRQILSRDSAREMPAIGEGASPSIAVRADALRQTQFSRRSFLRMSGLGVGALALFGFQRVSSAQTSSPSMLEQAEAAFKGMQYLTEVNSGLVVDKARIADDNGVRLLRNSQDFMKTSPTNIGLGILSSIIARDRGWISDAEASVHLTRAISTLEKLERLNGFWFNWYDLRRSDGGGTPNVTLNRFVSSVDNANLTASLMVLREAVAGNPLADRVQALLNEQDWDFFFNPDARLMNHGYDASENQRAPYDYGVFNTEARLGAFISVLNGVDQSVWDNMSREVRSDASGEIKVVAPWGGSLFEALFADTFMSAYGVLNQNNRDIIQVHINKAEELNLSIWGWSPASNTRGIYAEFGVPEIGIRGSGQGYPVGDVSPYSVLLAGPYQQDAVEQNLARMIELNEQVYHPNFGFRDSINPRTGRVAPDLLSLDKGMELLGLDMALNRQNRELGTVEEYFWQHLVRINKMEQARTLLRAEADKFEKAMQAFAASQSVEGLPYEKKRDLLKLASDENGWWTPGQGSTSLHYLNDAVRGRVRRIDYDVRPNGSFNGTFHKLNNVNPVAYEATHIVIGVRGIAPGNFPATFKIELKRLGRVVQKFEIRGITTQWRDLVFPLAENVGPIDEVTTVFENSAATVKRGSVLLSDVSLAVEKARSETREGEDASSAVDNKFDVVADPRTVLDDVITAIGDAFGVPRQEAEDLIPARLRSETRGKFPRGLLSVTLGLASFIAVNQILLRLGYEQNLKTDLWSLAIAFPAGMIGLILVDAVTDGVSALKKRRQAKTDILGVVLREMPSLSDNDSVLDALIKYLYKYLKGPDERKGAELNGEQTLLERLKWLNTLNKLGAYLELENSIRGTLNDYLTKFIDDRNPVKPLQVIDEVDLVKKLTARQDFPRKHTLGLSVDEWTRIMDQVRAMNAKAEPFKIFYQPQISHSEEIDDGPTGYSTRDGSTSHWDTVIDQHEKFEVRAVDQTEKRSEVREEPVTAHETEEGFTVYNLTDPVTGSSFEIVPDWGFTVTSFKFKDGQQEKEILYYPRKEDGSVDIRQSGGIPILFPFANRVRDGRFTWKNDLRLLKGVAGTKDDAKGHTYHGMVRHAEWQVEDAGYDKDRGVYIKASFSSINDNDVAQAIFKNFGALNITITYFLKASNLRMYATIESLEGDETRRVKREIPLNFTLHPWFAIPEAEKERKQVGIEVPANERWIADGHLLPETRKPIRVDDPEGNVEKFDLRDEKQLGNRSYDDVYTGLIREASGSTTSHLVIPTQDLSISVRGSEGFKHIVLFAPPDKPTVSIEPSTSATDAFNLYTAGIEEATPVVLKPGDVRSYEMTIGVSHRSETRQGRRAYEPGDRLINLKFSPVSFGTYTFGRTKVRFPGERADLPGIDEARRTIKIASDRTRNGAGVYMIDTARRYLKAEELIGQVFEEQPELAEGAFIVTKWGLSLGERDAAAAKRDHSVQNLRVSFGASVEHLGHIDLLYIHNATPEVLKDRAVMEEMKRLKLDGRVGFIGATISSRDDKSLPAIVNQGLYGELDAIQISGKAFLKHPDLIQKIYEGGVAVFIHSPISSTKDLGISEEEVYRRILEQGNFTSILSGSLNHLEETVDFVNRQSRSEARAFNIPALSEKDISAVILAAESFSEATIKVRETISSSETADPERVREMFQVQITELGFFARPIEDVYEFIPRQRLGTMASAAASSAFRDKEPEVAINLIKAFGVTLAVSNNALYGDRNDLDYVFGNYSDILAALNIRKDQLKRNHINFRVLSLLLGSLRVRPQFDSSGNIVQLVVEPYNQKKHREQLDRRRASGHLLERSDVESTRPFIDEKLRDLARFMDDPNFEELEALEAADKLPLLVAAGRFPEVREEFANIFEGKKGSFHAFVDTLKLFMASGAAESAKTLDLPMAPLEDVFPAIVVKLLTDTEKTIFRKLLRLTEKRFSRTLINNAEIGLDQKHEAMEKIIMELLRSNYKGALSIAESLNTDEMLPEEKAEFLEVKAEIETIEETEAKRSELRSTSLAVSGLSEPDVFETVISVPISTEDAVDRSVAILRSGRDKEGTIDEATIQVSETIGLMPIPGVLAARQGIGLRDAVVLVLRQILSENLVDPNKQQKVIETVLETLKAGDLFKSAKKAPVHTMVVADDHELAENLEANLYALAALLIAFPKDRYTVYVSSKPGEKVVTEPAAAREKFRRILGNLIDSTSLAQRLNFQIVEASDSASLRTQLIQDAMKSINEEGLEISLLSDSEVLLYEVRSLLKARRINREGFAVADSTVLSATALRDQLSDDYEIISLKQELRALDLEDTAELVGTMIQAVKRLAAAA